MGKRTGNASSVSSRITPKTTAWAYYKREARGLSHLETLKEGASNAFLMFLWEIVAGVSSGDGNRACHRLGMTTRSRFSNSVMLILIGWLIRIVSGDRDANSWLVYKSDCSKQAIWRWRAANVLIDKSSFLYTWAGSIMYVMVSNGDRKMYIVTSRMFGNQNLQ